MQNSIGKVAGRWVRNAWRLWCALLQGLLGAWEWQAPPWGRWLEQRAVRGARLAIAGAQSRPMAAGLALLFILGLIGGSGVLRHWYLHRPKPDYASFTIAVPGRTRIEVLNAKPEPLLVTFDRSTAALALAGKEIPTGIHMQPAIAGKWRWINDQVLEFRVAADWPVGQTVDVTLDKPLFGPQIRLASYDFKFTTAAFAAHLANIELYQDPVNPGIKQGVFDLRFTHPVDPAEFERRIEVRLNTQQTGVLGVGRETTPFTVTYDKLRLNASIHSAALPIPKNPAELQLTIGAGIRSARGGNRFETPLTGAVHVPGLFSLSISGLEPLVVNTDRNEPDQVLMLTLSASTGEREVARAVNAWLLPTVRPAHDTLPAAGSDTDPYPWYDAGEVTTGLLKAADSVPLTPIAAEREYVESHSFHYHADVGRYLYVQVEKNLRSFGGYSSPRTERFVIQVPPFPPQLNILSQGSLLALSGDHKVVALVRDLPGVRIDIGRLLPAQLQHLVSQSDGEFAKPTFGGAFGPDNLVERFEIKTPLPNLPHGQAHYEPIDLSSYLNDDGKQKRGVFLLKVQGYDPKAEAKQHTDAARAAAVERQPGAMPPESTENEPQSGESEQDASVLQDSRLVLVTDLGILSKKSVDGSQDVFVQSIKSGQPVSDATVEIIGKNGTTLFSRVTDVTGRAHFAKLDGLAHEREPLMIQAVKEGDLSFLPLNRADRGLDMSRFDVGGIRSARSANQISAYLFSDRGIYRPGDTLHVGMITKTADWSKALSGIPLEAEVVDSRGLAVKRERFKLPAAGFSELSFTTADTAPTGTYTINLYLLKESVSGALLGSTSVRVQEFEADRTKVTAHLSAESADGWVSPKDLAAVVNVQNLFGTPAENRRVEASLTLTPAYPAFRGVADYRFYDPLRAKNGYDEQLPQSITDAAGNAKFDLGLQKYANATYRVHFLARAFEPAGGRSVAADTAMLVSEMPFLVGFKADGDLNYLSRGGPRHLSLIAIDPKAQRTTGVDLHLSRIETQYVSVLTKQANGLYKYESRKKETTLSDEPLVIPADGLDLTAASDSPGTFAYIIKNSAGLELNRIEYTVAGAGNVTRSLERNAELQITLDKKDYAPGEDIELSIKAPYTGAGLITIERDHVYATQWFKSDTTASVQKIRVPKEFEGNGYVSVQFVRDANSDEIFTSPLSYGVAPFMTSLKERTNVLTLSVPALVKPGTVLKMHLSATHATRAVVFAVDEGILQVAHYQAPDPLSEFFKKRALEVRTSQILDLILPEFKRLLAAAAPGGDGESALRRNLNPFKRKRDKPAVYWSGIVDVGTNREFAWAVPDTFNGALKVFAVSVNDAAIGIAESDSVVRGDFVLTPNMPVAVAPGDEFDVSVGVANNIVDSADGANVTVEAQLPPQLAAVGAVRQELVLAAMREGVVRFRFRAKAQLGSATIHFRAAWKDHDALLSSAVSVRPASPYVTDITAGFFGSEIDIPVQRDLYPDYRKLKLGVSALPLVLAGGLADYLSDYPHLCTEQLVSRGFASLILARRSDLGDPSVAFSKPGEATAALVAVLRSRQNAEGGFGLWDASVTTNDFASVHAVHWLLEAHEQGEPVPVDLMQRSLVWLQQYAASPVRDAGSSGLWGLRNRAYAVYLLTRQGMVTAPLVASLRETLDARYPANWKTDDTAAFLAAAYQLQKQGGEANALMEGMSSQLGQSSGRGFAGYSDDTIRDAEVLYLLSRHFAARARALEPRALEALVAPLQAGRYNTLSSAWLIMAFDAYASDGNSTGLNKFTAFETRAGAKRTALDLKGEVILRGAYSQDAVALHLTNATGINGFYAVTNAGFDRNPPATALQQGIEMERDYLTPDGQPIKTVKTGDELIVRLRLRTLESSFIPNVAVTDLLPGGFEPVLQSAPAATAADGERSGVDRIGIGGNWRPEFADVREDRVVLYGSLSKSLAEYSYRIRATNAGTFLLPPSFAESMYDRGLRARTAAGRITVDAPSH